MRPLHDQLVAAIRDALGDHPVRRVLDLGSGPGVATTLLAESFAAARATAADASAPLLELAVARAGRLGLAERVHTQVVDLEGPLDVLAVDGPADVVWASMVLHHVGGLPHTLVRIRDLLAPGGVLALVEFGHDHRTLPPESIAERPGFAERHAGVVRGALAAHLPPGALELDWPALLADAGFEVVQHEQGVQSHDPPLDPAARAFQLQSLEVSARIGLRQLDDLDLLTLARLLDEREPASVMRRDDLPLRISRTLVVARRG